MNYIEYSQNTKLSNTAATTGFFDGVHAGHRAVLSRLIAEAEKNGLSSTVITFWPHPRIVLQKSADDLLLLNTLAEKRYLMEQMGIDNFVVIPFTLDFASLSAGDFIADILHKQLGVKQFIVGYDHHLGKGGQTSFPEIQQMCTALGIVAEQVQANQVGGVNVSSSKIREALDEGNVSLATKWLGYHYILSGKVVHGQQLGRKLGYPTANIQPESPLKLIPRYGIYAVEVERLSTGETYRGMLSSGVRPTIDDSMRHTIEVNIFDFDEEIYGETLTVKFVEWLREEWKLPSLEALKNQLAQDKLDTVAVFNKKIS